MKAHDVRRLRYCDECEALADKDDFADDHVCLWCGWEKAQSLEVFMAKYPEKAWRQLTLGMVGVEGMRKLLAALTPKAPRP